MGKKVYEPITDPNHPIFQSANTAGSLQEKPVDFRNVELVPLSPDDPLFMDEETRNRRENYQKLATARSKGSNPLKGLPKIEQDAVDKSLPLMTTPEDARTRLEILNQSVRQLETELSTVDSKLQRERTFRGVFSGRKAEVKEYIADLVKTLNEVKQERQNLIEKRIDTADIDSKLSQLNKEYEETLRQINVEQGYRMARTAPGSTLIGTELIRRTKDTGVDLQALEQKRDQLAGQMGSLREQRKALERAANPLSDAEKQEIILNKGAYSNNIKDNDVGNKYTAEEISLATREFLNDAMVAKAKDNIDYLKKRGDNRSLLSGEALFNDDKVEISVELAQEAQGYFKDIQRSAEYQNADFIQKRAVVNKLLKNELATKYEDPEMRKQKETQLTPVMRQLMFFNEDGSRPSLNGLQMVAEYVHGDLVDRKIDLESQLKALPGIDKAYNPQGSSLTGVTLNDVTQNISVANEKRRSELEAQYGKENYTKYYQELAEEYKLITDAIEFTDHILKMDPKESYSRKYLNNQFINNFEEGLKATPVKHLLSAGITQMMQMFRIGDIAEKAANGEVSWTEAKVLDMYTMMNMANASDEVTMAYRIGMQTSQMLPYVASFGATSPLYGGGKAATKQVLKQTRKIADKALRRGIVNRVEYELPSRLAKVYGKKVFSAPELASRVLQVTAGTSLQTAAQPMLYSGLTEKTMPNMNLNFTDDYEGLYSRIEAKTPEEIKAGKREARQETFAEIFTERMGAYIMRGFKLPGAVMNPEGAAKRYMLSKYLDVAKANNPAKPINKLIRKGLGWDGIAEEYFEELANYFMVRAAKGDTSQDPRFFEQQLETLATVAIFGAAMKGANIPERYQEIVYGDNVRYSFQLPSGKKGSVVLDRQINEELQEIFASEDEYAKPVTALLNKYGNELSEKQVGFILMLTGQKHKEKVIEKVNEPVVKPGAEETREALLDEILEKTGLKSEPQPSEDPGKKKTTTKKKKDEDQAELPFEGTMEKKLGVPAEQTKEKFKQPPEGIQSEEELHDWIADNSNNPQEIYDAWVRESEKTQAEEVDLNPLEEFVIGQKIKTSSWNQFSDRKTTDRAIGRTWLNKDGRSLDDLRDEAASMPGIPEDITIQDIIDIIFKYPGNRAKTTSEIQDRLAKRYKQYTGRNVEDRPPRKVESESIPMGEEAFGEIITEGTTAEEDTVEVTPKEQKEIDKHNQKMAETYPELYNAGLMTVLPSGQMEVPTYEEMIARVEDIVSNLNELTERDQFGNLKVSQQEAITMLNQLEVLKREINEQAKTKGVPFEYQLPSEKHFSLELQLRAGEKLIGKLTNRMGMKLRLQLKDGRSINVFGNQKTQKDFEEALQNGEEVSLKLIPAKVEDQTRNKIAVMYKGKQIAIVQNTDNETIAYLREKAEEAREYVAGEWQDLIRIVRTPSGMMYSGIPINPEKLAAATKKLASIAKGLFEKGITDLRIIVEHIKNNIRESKNTPMEEKQFWLKFVDDNIDVLRAAITKEDEKFDPENMEEPFFDNPDVAFLSGGQKMDANLKTFNTIWKEVAKASDTSKAKVERKFHEIANLEEFDLVTDEASFQGFLESLEADDVITSNLLRYLSSRPFEEVLSVFNFYRNVRILKIFGMNIHPENEVRLRLLNQENKFAEFVASYYYAAKNYVYFDEETKQVHKGYKGIWMELRNHQRQANQRRIGFEQKTPEERTAIRREQWEEDLKLLSKITGIDIPTWRQYFKSKTGETSFASAKFGQGKTIFETYEEILTTDLFTGKRNTTPRTQSNIVGVLQSLTYLHKDKRSFKKALDQFFTVGKIIKGREKSRANLYKLATAQDDQNELASSAMDIKRNRITSFVQVSHVLIEAERQGREVVVLNGIHNLDKNKDKDGSPARKMSVDDIWYSLIHFYLEGQDTFYQHMGQFGDKDSLLLIDSQKIKPTEEHYNDLRKIFPDFDEAVQHIYDTIIVPSKEEFVFLENSKFQGKARNIEGKTLKDKRMNLAREFTYNYAVHMLAINRDFHGDISQYAKKDTDGLVGLMKRGGSTNSPGYRLNPNVKDGVGKSYRVLYVNDELKDGTELFDGLSLMSRSFADRVAVSMGSIYNRLKPNKKHKGFSYLTSIKALHSNVQNGRRGLMKTNNINVDVFGKIQDSKYEKMKKLMEKHKVDMIVFTSGSKLLMEDPNVQPVELFDELGNIIPNAQISKQNISERSTSDLYVQQDLRHSTQPTAKRMASQQRTNTFFLPNGIEISRLAYQIQMQAIREFEAVFDKNVADDKRLKWVQDYINEYSQPEVYRMIQAGVGFNEPSIKQLLRNYIANHISRNILEIPTNRINTQEIPDIDGVLKERKEIQWKDEQGETHTKVLLPDIATNIDGGRAHRYTFKNKPQQAIDHVMANKATHRDLFDKDGNLMVWEITERDGVIPGEPVISTRVPADDLHSHTVGRLAINLPEGNFTMLDQESQKISGSDFDGDARFNQVLFRRPGGQMIEDNTKEGLANQMLMEMVWGYQDPAMSDKIKTPIDTKAYKGIVAKLLSRERVFNEADLRAYMKGWEHNKVGVDMKGILTDINTIFSLASTYQIQLKGNVYVPWKTGAPVSSDVPIVRMDLVDEEGGRKMRPEFKGRSTMDLIFIGARTATTRAKKAGWKVGQEIVFEDRTGRRARVRITKAAYNTSTITPEAWSELEGWSTSVYEPNKFQYQFELIGEVDPNTRVQKRLTGFINDIHGQMKVHIANLLNMAFDNAKDPQIELMGLNEITVNMWMTAIMTDPELEVKEGMTPAQHYKLIYDAIDSQVEFFTSPMVKEFVRLMRRQNGGLVRKDTAIVWKAMFEKFDKQDVNNLRRFYNQTAELPEIRALYRYTQQVPKSSTELYEAKELVKKMENNEYTLFDSSKFFIITPHGAEFKTELRIVPRILQFMEEKLYFDAVEYTKVGKSVLNYLFHLLNEEHKKRTKNPKAVLKRFSRSQFDSIIFRLNNILAARSLNKEKPFREVEAELFAAYDVLDKESNAFLEKIHIEETEFGPALMVTPEYRTMMFDEVETMRIHQDYNKLPYNFRAKMEMYIFHKFGTSASRFRGSPYSLIGDKRKLLITLDIQRELNDWIDGALTPEEQYNIAQYLIYSTNDPSMKELWDKGERSAAHYDLAVAQTGTNIPLGYDALEDALDVQDNTGVTEWKQEYGFTGLRDYLAIGLDIRDPRFVSNFIPWAQKVIAAKEDAMQFFPNQTEDISEDELKDMVAEDAIGEALASDDPAIQDFILERLQQLYPTVEFFRSREAFYNFLRKNGARLRNISPSAIGHALGNAVFVDPETGVQSSILHEYAHIYWDALPDNHETKRKLMQMFSEMPENKGLTEEEIEEKIILAIGRSAFNVAESGINSSLWKRFENLLKEFWKAVKQFFGGYSAQNLVDDMAYALWTNQDNINPQSITGKAVLKNMAKPSMNPYFDSQRKMYVVGGRYFHRVSMLADHAKKNKFNPDEQARFQADREAAEYEQASGQPMPHGEYIARINQIKNKWLNEKEAGEVVGQIVEQIFGGEAVNPDFIKSTFVTDQAYQNFVRSVEKFKEAILKKYPDAQFETARITYSLKNRIAGKISVKVKVGDNKYILVNFKTTKFAYKQANGELDPRYTRSYGQLNLPFPENAPDSKQMENFIQVGSYAMMEEELGDEIVEAWIVPVVKNVNEEGNLIAAKVADNNPDPLKNVVRVPWRTAGGKVNETNKARLQALMKSYDDRRKKNTLPNKSNKDEMIRNGVDPRVAEAMVAAEEYLSGDYKLDEIKYTDVEEIANLGLRDWLSALFKAHKGYSRADTINIPLKYLFFLGLEDKVKDPLLKWKGEEADKNPYIERVEVGNKFKFKENPRSDPKVTRYRVDTGGKDVFVEEAGYLTLKVGDEVAEIVENKSKGRKKHDVYLFTVTNVDTINKKITVESQVTGDTFIMDSIDSSAGIMRLIEDDESIISTYNPKYIKERISEIAYQWKRLTLKDFNGDQARYDAYLQNIRVVDKFFDKYNTIEKLREFLNDNRKAMQFYQKIRGFDDVQSSQLRRLIGGSLMAHYMADQIRYEASHMKSREVKPGILNIFLLLNPETDKHSMFNFDQPWIAKYLAPARMLSGKYLPLHYITGGVRDAYNAAVTDQIELKRRIEPLYGKINQANIVVMVGETEYYKKPNDPSLSKADREFLEIIYEYHYKYDSRFIHLNKGKGYFKNIPVSKMFATKSEMKQHFGSYGRAMKALLTPRAYDQIELDEVRIVNGRIKKTGAKTTLGRVKDQFQFERGNDAHNREYLGVWTNRLRYRIGKSVNPGLLRYYDSQASRKYDETENIDPEIKRKKSIIPIAGRTRPKYESIYRDEAAGKIIEGLIYDYHMKPMLAPMDELMNLTHGNTDVKEWIKDYTDAIIFKRPPRQTSLAIAKFVGKILRINSLNKIAWNIPLQFKNLAIGVAMNYTREPAAYVKGLRRVVRSLSHWNQDKINDLRKVINIMRKNNMVITIVDDSAFDQLDRMITKTINLNKNKRQRLSVIDVMIESGYKPMELFEKAIQVPLFMGLMTREEFNAYDIHGNVIDPKNALSRTRRNVIEDRLRDVHGDYNPINANPYWMTPLGSALFQFRKWAPAMINREFAAYHIDKDYQSKSGVIPTVVLLSKIFNPVTGYNRKSDQKRKKEYDDIISELKRQPHYNKVFYSGMNEYLDRLIADTNGNKIKIKDLSDSDKRNILSAIHQLAIYTLLTLARLALTAGGGDDDDEKASKFKRILAQFLGRFLLRYNADIYFFASTDQWTYIAEDPLAATSLLVAMLRFTTELNGYIKGFNDSHIDLTGPDAEIDIHSNGEVYLRDSKYALEGWPKFLIRSTYLIPLGSQVRSSMETILWSFDNRPKYDLNEIFAEAGMNEKEIEDMITQIGKEKLSNYDIRTESTVWKRFKERINKGLEYLNQQQMLEEKLGREADRYDVMDLVREKEYYDDLEKEQKLLQDALELRQFLYNRANGLMDEGMEEQLEIILEAAEEAEKNEQRVETRRKKKREHEKYQPTVELLNE